MSRSGELIAPDPPRVDSLRRALGTSFSVSAGETSVRERTYLDSFDARLRAEGLSLRFERGRFELFAGDEELPGEAELAAEVPEPPRAIGVVHPEELPPGGLRDRVAPLLGIRVLVPRARVRVQVQPLAVLDDLEKTVARVSVEVPSLLVDGHTPAPLPVRLVLRGLRGYDEELDHVQSRLCDRLGAAPAEQSLSDEAVLACGGVPDGVQSRVSVDDLRGDDRTDRAVATVLLRLLGVIEANLPGTLGDLDPEFLHDFRVSVRRTRSVLRECKHAFPPERLEQVRTDFKWIQQVTGEARDLDVYVLGFEDMRELVPMGMRDDLDPLLGVLRRRRADAHRAMVRELRSARLRTTLDDFAELLDSLEDLPLAEREDAARPIGEVARKRIRKVYRRMVKMGREITADGAEAPPEAYHDLRKKGKELRYLLELFGDAAADGEGGAEEAVHEEVKGMTKELKALQDVLGHHQDREVQMEMLRELAGTLAAVDGGPVALMATGVLVARLESDAAEARAAFAEQFSEFAGKPQRRRIRALFPKPS